MGLAPQVLSSYESDNPNSYDDKSYESAPPVATPLLVRVGKWRIYDRRTYHYGAQRRTRVGGRRTHARKKKKLSVKNAVKKLYTQVTEAGIKSE